MFLPIIAGQGGIGVTQTVTLVVGTMASGDLPPWAGFRLLSQEYFSGLVNGLFLGVAVGAIALVMKGQPVLGLFLGLAMLDNMMIAALAGAGVPLLLSRRYRRQYSLPPLPTSWTFCCSWVWRPG